MNCIRRLIAVAADRRRLPSTITKQVSWPKRLTETAMPWWWSTTLLTAWRADPIMIIRVPLRWSCTKRPLMTRIIMLHKLPPVIHPIPSWQKVFFTTTKSTGCMRHVNLRILQVVRAIAMHGRSVCMMPYPAWQKTKQFYLAQMPLLFGLRHLIIMTTQVVWHVLLMPKVMPLHLSMIKRGI